MKWFILCLVLCISGCGGQRTSKGPGTVVQEGRRMIVISKQTYRNRNITVLKDKETGQEFLWVDYGDCMAITPIKGKEER